MVGSILTAFWTSVSTAFSVVTVYHFFSIMYIFCNKCLLYWIALVTVEIKKSFKKSIKIKLGTETYLNFFSSSRQAHYNVSQACLLSQNRRSYSNTGTSHYDNSRRRHCWLTNYQTQTGGVIWRKKSKEYQNTNWFTLVWNRSMALLTILK